MIADVLIIPLQVMFWYMYTLQTKLRNELSIIGIPGSDAACLSVDMTLCRIVCPYKCVDSPMIFLRIIAQMKIFTPVMFRIN